MRAITRDALRARIENGDDIVVVEALPASYWEEGHLPGAGNLPHDADDATIASVLPDRDATVVVYCANTACQNSTVLARRLDALGYTRVYEYGEGKQDWVEAGLPLESVARTP
ncbi:MAG TPA: rhodanese-like domain-containing protein [Acidimicrobiia bacterium]|nr:rhodanese-like domain-containing protein [Acidimicrobiia bacterium]